MLDIDPGDGGGPSSDEGSGADSDQSEDEYFCDLCATKSEDQEAINGPRWTLRPEGEYDDQVCVGERGLLALRPRRPPISSTTLEVSGAC